ncbi:ethanolamine utilization protein EutH [uncultured Clostridium sp.]|uniref:ethanolamine utilization protein EutH n=1 Tax=uncultured Clostridium sp. TaxID=59620 RepID=UPI0028E7F479|nr:ethanolamine utilization protein EutH [uncultured Clostridium sp.]
MGINEIIIYAMVIFMVLGAIDKCLDNKFGLGAAFEEGFMAMGSLTLAMVGVISLAPVLANILKPIVVPIYSALGADPAMFATTLLACDMGGFSLAVQLAQTPEAGLFAGTILGAMMGPTIVFTIPVALGIIEKEDHRFLATGVLAGIITIPLGALVGGLVAGFPIMMILKNLVPIILVAALIALGLWKMPDKMVKGFTYFGKFVVIIITIGLAAGVVEMLTGIVVIPGMAPISEGIAVVGDIAVVLAGAFPMVYIITKVFNKPLLALGKVLGMNDVAAAGLVATLANNIPMFGMMKNMDNRGKIINVAFAVSGAFVFGDHLGFVAGVAKNMIFPMIVGKLVGGVAAVFVAMFIANKILDKQKEEK